MMLLQKSGCALEIYLSARDARIVRHRNFDAQPHGENRFYL